MSTPVQSSNVPLQLSFDSGATWKDLVCMENYNIDRVTSTTDDPTFCGVFVGVGVITTTITGTAVVDTAPTGATQVSAKALADAQLAATLIKVRANYSVAGSAGGAISNNGDAYVTQVGEQFAVNTLVKFTFTLRINGIFV